MHIVYRDRGAVPVISDTKFGISSTLIRKEDHHVNISHFIK